eukprot:4129557-Prymnesium_polylepis.1
MLKLTPLSPLLKGVPCAVRARCIVSQWCKERGEYPRIPQRRTARGGPRWQPKVRFTHKHVMQ